MNTTGPPATPSSAAAPDAANSLLAGPPRIINIGLELFSEELTRQGAQVVHVRWSPPAGGNPRLAGLLAKLRS